MTCNNHRIILFCPSFTCYRWGENCIEESPGAETTSTEGIHGSFENKQRPTRGHKLTRTVSALSASFR